MTPSKSLLRHKAHRFRIYPNPEQEILIAKTIGCCRFVFIRGSIDQKIT